jgi:hypothetical protein
MSEKDFESKLEGRGFKNPWMGGGVKIGGVVGSTIERFGDTLLLCDGLDLVD